MQVACPSTVRRGKRRRLQRLYSDKWTFVDGSVRNTPSSAPASSSASLSAVAPQPPPRSAVFMSQARAREVGRAVGLIEACVEDLVVRGSADTTDWATPASVQYSTRGFDFTQLAPPRMPRAHFASAEKDALPDGFFEPLSYDVKSRLDALRDPALAVYIPRGTGRQNARGPADGRRYAGKVVVAFDRTGFIKADEALPEKMGFEAGSVVTYRSDGDGDVLLEDGTDVTFALAKDPRGGGGWVAVDLKVVRQGPVGLAVHLDLDTTVPPPQPPLPRTPRVPQGEDAAAAAAAAATAAVAAKKPVPKNLPCSVYDLMLSRLTLPTSERRYLLNECLPNADLNDLLDLLPEARKPAKRKQKKRAAAAAAATSASEANAPATPPSAPQPLQPPPPASVCPSFVPQSVEELFACFLPPPVQTFVSTMPPLPPGT